MRSEFGSIQMTQEEGLDAYTFASKARRQILHMGIPLPERLNGSSPFLHADGSPKIPFDIQSFSEREIGEMYSIVNAYFAYVSSQMADIYNQKQEAKEKFEFTSARVRQGKDCKTQKDKDDQMTTDRRYVMTKASWMELDAIYRLLSKVYENTEQQIKMISRNISMLDTQYRSGGREASISAKKNIKSTSRERVTYRTSEDVEEPPMVQHKTPARRPGKKVRKVKRKTA